MKEFSYTITDSEGIHARPAGLLVKAAQGFESSISIACREKTVNAKKLFALMGLAVKCGETIVVSADGADEGAAIESVSEFLKNNL